MRQTLTAVLCLLVVGAATSAGADVTVERYARSDGFAGMGGFESTTITTTGAITEREESKMKFTGGFMSAIQKMAGLGDAIRITRLDRDVVWQLDPEKKSYTEQPLTSKLERERAGRGQPAGRPSKGKDTNEPSDVVITKNEFKVEKTGARKVINGFPCDEYLMTWLVETLNQKTGETAKSLMTNRLWTTPESAEIRAAQAEQQAYQQAYLKKLGLTMSPAEAQQLMAGLTGLDEKEQQRALAKAAAEMRKVQGYTIVSDLAWTGEGSGGRAETRESPPPRSGGGQQDLGQVLGKLFGGAGGQKGGAAETPSSGRGGQERNGTLFNLYTEVKSIRATGPDPTRYEIPAGYTKK
jgi:hypothetical protein